jgi:hypothetical protein
MAWGDWFGLYVCGLWEAVENEISLFFLPSYFWFHGIELFLLQLRKEIKIYVKKYMFDVCVCVYD